jgi:UDP-glucose 4-epimerase
MNVCVVGNRGFIGRRVADVLLNEGLGSVTGLGKGALIAGAFDGAEAVIDLAPAGTMQHTYGFLERLYAAKAAGVGRYVVVSSGGAVYGRTLWYPIEEGQPTRPISSYGLWKLTQERIALEFENLPVIIVRPSNVYGPGQMAFAGQGLIATAMGCAITGRELMVYGNSIRDYVYVEDVARGIVAALYAGEPGQAYNIGTGVGRHNLDVVRDVRRVVAPARLGAKFEAARDTDVPINVLSSEKLYEQAYWCPRIEWEDGLRRTWKWLKERWAEGERNASQE